MRRSSAPSKKLNGTFTSPLLKSPLNNLKEQNAKISTPKGTQGSSKDCKGRSTFSILGLLNDQTSKENVTDSKTVRVENQINGKSSKSICSETAAANDKIRLFTVVYGKTTTKKHKTWEGDGVLEVGLKSATLKDDNGKVIGQTTKLKSSEIVEGSHLFVGGKEIEVIEETTCRKQNVNKRSLDVDEINEVSSNKFRSKKKKKSNVNHLVTLEQSFNQTSSSTFYKALLMPKPDDQHQWQYNVNHLPVTDVTVEANLCRVLRPHQREGVTFLYKCVTGIRSADWTGAILADEMGLGKTIQCITLIWTLLRQGPYGGNPMLKRVLIVVPSSLVKNWNNEFIRWIGSHKIKVFPVDKKNKPIDYMKYSYVPVMIISYEMFVRCFEDIKKINFDLLICDEGHRLKNSGIRTSSLLNEINCKRRILLTGTPVQNDLKEFYALVDFVNPGILGTPLDFRRTYELSITASREPNASEEIVTEGEKRAEELNRITNYFILRRTQSVIGTFLPQKTEYVVFCEASEFQKKLYLTATNFWNEREIEIKEPENVAHLSVITALKKICNHPILAKSREDQAINEESLQGKLDDILNGYNFYAQDSGKLIVVDAILENLQGLNERIVIVSNFTQTLDLMELICKSKEYKYLRFDGSTPVSQRIEIVDKFNLKTSDVYVLLLSSKAGGVGLNLIGGSRLLLYDSDWNPATDLQAMARIWREGQKKNVHIYRLLTSGTLEEKIFQRQLTKAGLSESVVDTTSTSSVKLSKEELKDLFTFTGKEKCLTHDMLKCACQGDGLIPQSMDCDDIIQEETTDAQLLLDNTSAPSSLRMNQLYQWEHHNKPIGSNILEEMKMNGCEPVINFIFKSC